jgi:hypothetical protein
VDRYSAQKELLRKREEEVGVLLKEHTVPHKSNESAVDKDEYSLMKQNVRVLQSSVDEKRAQLERSKINLDGAKEEVQLLLVLQILH